LFWSHNILVKITNIFKSFYSEKCIKCSILIAKAWQFCTRLLICISYWNLKTKNTILQYANLFKFKYFSRLYEFGHIINVLEHKKFAEATYTIKYIYNFINTYLQYKGRYLLFNTYYLQLAYTCVLIYYTV